MQEYVYINANAYMYFKKFIRIKMFLNKSYLLKKKTEKKHELICHNYLFNCEWQCDSAKK